MNTIYASPAGAAAVQRRYRELLARWPVPNVHLSVPTSQGDTLVVASGPVGAPPLVLLHGSGATTAMWLGDVAAWARDFRVYALDIPGEPGLSTPSRPALASDGYARWLGEVLDALGVDRASIVGTSLGGWIAADFATRHPDRVQRLALITPSGIGRQKVGMLLLALLLLLFGHRGREITMRLVLGPAANALGDMGDYVLLIHQHFRPRREKIPRFTDKALTRLTMPVLAVVGGKDALLDSTGTKRRLEHNAPHATVELLPDAGHLLPRQTDRILTFLNSCTSRSGRC
jgi:pimeloyl-ACP methyl ester carboxylesterase